MKGFVYRLVSPSHPEAYYGSTISPLPTRFIQHKSIYKTNPNSTRTSNLLLCYDDCIIELVEEVEYTVIKELHDREGHYIRTSTCVNKKIAGRTWAEYNREYNKTYREGEKRGILLQKKKEYHEKNKEEINKKRREKRALELEALSLMK